MLKANPPYKVEEMEKIVCKHDGRLGNREYQIWLKTDT